jgi:hypothetical protein
MSTITADQAALAQTVAEAAAKLDPAAQPAFISAAIPAPTAPAINQLWVIFISGLSIALLVALVGGVVLAIDGKTTDVAVTAFSSLLTGLLGLFAPSPAAQGGA